MPIQRNDPCPCGSGRKYKHCCGRAERADARSDAARRLGALSRQATQVLQRFAGRTYGRVGFVEAWEECWGEDASPLGPHDVDMIFEEIGESPFVEAFLPWFLLHWTREPGDRRNLASLRDDTIVGEYLATHARHATAELRAFLDAWRREPFSFFEVKEVLPERGSLLRDLVLDREVFVQDAASTRTLSRWDVLLAQVVGTGGDYIFGALAPYGIRPDRVGELEPTLKRIRKHRPQRPEDLLPFVGDLIAAYHDLDPGAPRPMPELQNTDGDALVWTRMTFDLDPAARDEVARALAAIDEVETSSGADEEGDVYVWVETSRHGTLETVTKGRITLRSDVLEAQCNSRERARVLRGRIEQAAGDRVRHRETTHEVLDAERMQREKVPGAETSRPETPPELKALEVQFLERAIRAWADEPIPALGGKTPRQAARTAKGRADVAALIKGWENMLARKSGDAYRVAFEELRAELGVGQA